jgi:hypothetical protein
MAHRRIRSWIVFAPSAKTDTMWKAQRRNTFFAIPAWSHNLRRITMKKRVDQKCALKFRFKADSYHDRNLIKAKKRAEKKMRSRKIRRTGINIPGTYEFLT